MTYGPEDIAREQIDRMLELSGWAVQDAKAVYLYAKQGVAIREFELKSGYGTADYLLYVAGRGQEGDVVAPVAQHFPPSSRNL